MDKMVTEKEFTVKVNQKRIKQIRFLTDSTFVLRFDRDDMQFYAGQHIIVGPEGSLNQREYSVYSGEKDYFLEILVKEVKEGNISPLLRNSNPGDLLEVNGPFGSFILDPADMYSRKYLFIATGTGISPFHSIVKSYPGIDYTIMHGIPFMKDAYEKEEYNHKRYIPCVSREKGSRFTGRVTDLLPQYPDEPGMLYYLCGNGEMIYQVSRILEKKGVTRNRIFKEIYF
jgi:ferredoxin--NADP+ reductase/benzoate/toluate 1,2-dioxygenase reductase subunit